VVSLPLSKLHSKYTIFNWITQAFSYLF